ncbi:MAG: hypothetical protein WD556_12615 [Actinomycetota bacterium]
MAQRVEVPEPPEKRPPEERPPDAAVLGWQVFRRRTGRFPKMGQRDLAERCKELGDSGGKNTVSAIERSRLWVHDPRTPLHNPTLSTIEVVARALECSSRDLLTWDPSLTRV